MDTAFRHRSSGSCYVMDEELSEPLPPRSGSSSDESQHGSDLKRQKVEESDDGLEKIENSNDVEIDEAAAEEDDCSDDSSSDGSDFSSWFPQDEEGKKKLEIYLQSIRDSEGYDVADCPLDIVGFDHGFLRVYLDDPKEAYHVGNVKRSVKFVIYEQYRMGNKMKLVKIENASQILVNGYNYYITFSAETWPTRQIKVYQAEVYCKFGGKVVHTNAFREKPPPKQQPQSSCASAAVYLRQRQGLASST